MRKVLRSPFAYVLLAAVVAMVLFSVLRSGPSRTTLSLGEYQHDLAARGTVVDATIHDSSYEVTGRLSDGTNYVVQYPASGEVTSQLTTAILNSGATVTVAHGKSNPWLTILGDYVPFVLLLGLILFCVNALQGGGSRIMQFGKAKVRTPGKDQPTVTFADVAGADEAVAELQEIKEFLQSPSRFQAVGAKIPKGVLLFGPPGTGKTLLARAVAGEAGVPFFSISGSDFVEMFVGVGASRVRNLFEQAKTNAPAIVFMDEIDAVGRHRGAGMGGGHDEREQTLNQLLVEMDGFDVHGGVILIAATNRPDILDPALLRPGRFDRQIVVDRPDVTGRSKILAVHAQDKPLAASADLDVLAKRTPGFTGADLANLLNEAAILSVRRNLQHIGMRECEDAIDRVLAGPERKTLVMSDHDKLVTAYHEAGHAVVGHVLPHADPIHKVSIVARSRSLGLTFTLPEDRYNHSRSHLRDSMAMCLGGRTAEELVFSEPTTGAENDIEKVTRIARAMVTEYGMSEALGPQQFGQRDGEVFLGRDFGHQPNYSEEIAAAIDREVRVLIDEAHERARAVLVRHRDTLDRMARELVERETLDSFELTEILGPLEAWSGAAGSEAGSSANGSSDGGSSEGGSSEGGSSEGGSSEIGVPALTADGRSAAAGMSARIDGADAADGTDEASHPADRSGPAKARRTPRGRPLVAPGRAPAGTEAAAPRNVDEVAPGALTPIPGSAGPADSINSLDSPVPPAAGAVPGDDTVRVKRTRARPKPTEP